MDLYVKILQDLKCAHCDKILGRIIIERVYDPDWGYEDMRPYTTQELNKLLDEAALSGTKPGAEVFDTVRARLHARRLADNAFVRCNVCRNKGYAPTHNTFHIPLALWDTVPEQLGSSPAVKKDP